MIQTDILSLAQSLELYVFIIVPTFRNKLVMRSRLADDAILYEITVDGIALELFSRLTEN